jgi:hypothetical protein
VRDAGELDGAMREMFATAGAVLLHIHADGDLV